MTVPGVDLRAVADEAGPALVGGRVRDVRTGPGDRLVLRVRAARRDLPFLLCAEPRRARAHLLSAWPPAPSTPPVAGPRIRRRLRGLRVAGLRALESGPCLELDLTPPAGPEGDAPPGPDAESAQPVTVVLCLSGRRAELVLIDAERRFVDALVPVRRGGAPLEPGDAWSPRPAPAPPAGTGVAETSGDATGADEASPGGAPEGLPDPGGAARPSQEAPEEFPLSRRLERAFEEREREEALRARREALARDARRERKRRSRSIRAVEEDLESARGRTRDRELGELLKASMHELRRGQEAAEVVDWYAGGDRRVRVELDPALSPQENVERYFRRWRKARRALEVLGPRLERLREEQEAIEALLSELEESPGDERLSELEERLEGLRRVRPSKSSKKPGRGRRRAREVRAGPRRFVSADGLEILVSRNAQEGDRLTFRTARGNDLFCHVAGRPGSHVIVRLPRGREPPPETVEDAAQLALWYSLPHRSSEAFTQGARADVDWTRVKHVTKPRGAPAGRVLLAQHKTHRVALDRERIERLREGAGAPPSD